MIIRKILCDVQIYTNKKPELGDSGFSSIFLKANSNHLWGNNSIWGYFLFWGEMPNSFFSYETNILSFFGTQLVKNNKISVKSIFLTFKNIFLHDFNVFKQ